VWGKSRDSIIPTIEKGTLTIVKRSDDQYLRGFFSCGFICLSLLSIRAAILV